MSEVTFNILGIDPGTSTTGYSLLIVRMSDLSIAHARGWTIDASKRVNPEDYTSELYGSRFLKVAEHGRLFRKYLKAYNPLIVVSESPFYNPKRPQAFAALLEIIMQLKTDLYNWDPWMQLFTIDPSTAKKNLHVSGISSDKELIMNAIKTNDELKQFDYSHCDEHSADAISIAYCKLCQIREKQMPVPF